MDNDMNKNPARRRRDRPRKNPMAARTVASCRRAPRIENLPSSIVTAIHARLRAGALTGEIFNTLGLAAHGIRADSFQHFANRFRRNHKLPRPARRAYDAHHSRVKRFGRGPGNRINSPFDLPADILDKVYHLLDRAMAGPSEIYRLFGLGGYGIALRSFQVFCEERRKRLGLPFADGARPVSARVSEAADILCRVIDGMGLSRYAALVMEELAERIARPKLATATESGAGDSGDGDGNAAAQGATR